MTPVTDRRRIKIVAAGNPAVRCSTCRWWEAPFGVGHHPERGRCVRFDEDDGGLHYEFHVTDGGMAWIETDPTFACSDWEAR